MAPEAGTGRSTRPKGMRKASPSMTVWGVMFRRALTLVALTSVTLVVAGCSNSQPGATVTVTSTETISATASEPAALDTSESADALLPALVDAINETDLKKVESLTVAGSPARQWTMTLAGCRKAEPSVGPWESVDFTDGETNGSGALANFTYSGKPVSDRFNAVSAEETVDAATLEIAGAAQGQTATFYTYRVTNGSPDRVFIEFFGYADAAAVLPWEFQFAQEVPSDKIFDGCLISPLSNIPDGVLSVRWSFLGSLGQFEKDVELERRE